MTFLLLLLSYFFQLPKAQSAEHRIASTTGSSDKVEIQLAPNELYVFDDHSIFSLGPEGTTQLQDYESEKAQWIFASTAEGLLIGAKARGTEFFLENNAGDRNSITLEDDAETFEILDITYHQDTIEFLARGQFSEAYLVKYAIASGDIWSRFLGGTFVDFNGGGFYNNRIRNPLSETALLTYFSWTYEGYNRTLFPDPSPDQIWKDPAFEEFTDLAFDAYGELYGVANNTLYHVDFDSDSVFYVPYSLSFDHHVKGVFSHIETTKPYGLAPKSQAFKRETDQGYTGYVKLKNRFDTDLQIRTIEVSNDMIQVEEPEKDLLAKGESVYLSFSVQANTEIDLKAYITLHLESGGITFADSVFVDGLIYEPTALTDEDILLYDDEAYHFVDQNEEIIDFPREIDIAAANASGLIYAISGTNMYRIDPATQNMTLLQNLFTPRSYQVSSIFDMAFDGEDTYYTISATNDFRGAGSSHRISYAHLTDGYISSIPTSDFVSSIAYSKTRKSVYFLIQDGGTYTLYQHYVPRQYTLDLYQLDPEIIHIEDIFFDAQDELKMIYTASGMKYMAKIDLETGAHEVLETLPAGIDFGVAKLSSLPDVPDLEIEIVLDVDQRATSSLEVFPNPVSTSFQVNSDEPIARLRLMNVSGQVYELTSEQKGTVQHWTPTNAEPGVYVLRVFLKTGQVKSFKVILD